MHALPLQHVPMSPSLLLPTSGLRWPTVSPLGGLTLMPFHQRTSWCALWCLCRRNTSTCCRVKLRCVNTLTHPQQCTKCCHNRQSRRCQCYPVCCACCCGCAHISLVSTNLTGELCSTVSAGRQHFLGAAWQRASKSDIWPYP